MQRFSLFGIIHSPHFNHVFLHPSAGPSKFEIYEFLGDKVLGLIVAEQLFATASSEGGLSTTHANWVNKHTLSRIGELLELDRLIKTRGDIQKDTLLADGFEAFIGAVYLTQGLSFTKDLWYELSQSIDSVSTTNKTYLQEWAHKQQTTPLYTTVKTGGAEHKPIFSCTVTIKNQQAQGIGPSKKSAENAAASVFIQRYIK